MKTLMTALAMGAACAMAASAQPTFEWSAEIADAVDDRVRSGAYGTVTSVLVQQNGQIIHEAYFNNADAQTLHDTRSVTKTVTGMAVGAAVREGLVGEHAPLEPLFADLAPLANPSVAKSRLNAADLLTMSGGLECDDWNSFSAGNEERMYISANWSRFFWDLPQRGYPAWSPRPEQRPYGRAFSYCTAGVQILGEAVGRTSGMSFTDFVEQRIFQPLGIEAFEWPRNGEGQAHMGGGLRLTTRDLARLGELQRRGGRWQGREVFAPAWALRSITPAAAVPDTDWEYGYLWWLRRIDVQGQETRIAAMSGNGGSRVYIIPAWDMTIVLTKTDYNSPGMHDQARAFFDTEIAARLRR